MAVPTLSLPIRFDRLALLCVGITLAVNPVARAGQAGSSSDDQRSNDSEVRLRAGTWDDVERAVRSARGKIVVVDIWSTSCRPCMDEFPGLVRLHKLAKGDVVCISFNVDYAGLKKRPPEFYRDRVSEFLQESDAQFLNILSTEESDAIYDRLNLPSIPAVLVYGTDARLAQQFDARMQADKDEEEPFNYRDDIVPFVKRLLQDSVRR